MSNEYLNNKTFEIIINRFQIAKKNKYKCEFLLEEILETKERLSKRIPGFDDALIQSVLVMLNTACRELKESQNELATAFYTLANNIVNYAKFNLDGDDLIQEMVMTCFEKTSRFNPKRGKAFNYFSTCMLNSARQSWRSAKNYNELKRKFHEFSSLTMMSNGKFV